MTAQEDAIGLLSEMIAPLAESYRMRAVYLFGSRAAGDDREDSDYDLLVDPPEGFSYRRLFAFRDEVSEMLGRDVDVLTTGSLADDGFSRRVRYQMVLLYARGGAVGPAP